MLQSYSRYYSSGRLEIGHENPVVRGARNIKYRPTAGGGNSFFMTSFKMGQWGMPLGSAFKRDSGDAPPPRIRTGSE